VPHALHALHGALRTFAWCPDRRSQWHWLQDCNLVLYNSNGQEPADFVFATGTSGSGPCHVAVSSAGGGGFAVIDESSGSALFTAGAYSPAGTPAGTLASAHDLAQVRCCLIMHFPRSLMAAASLHDTGY
jgi:hypothetical protein